MIINCFLIGYCRNICVYNVGSVTRHACFFIGEIFFIGVVMSQIKKELKLNGN